MPKALIEAIKAKKRPLMFILMGIPASGKSTFCKKYLSDFVRLNLDTIGNRKKEEELLIQSINASKNIVIDNTNVLYRDRQVYIFPRCDHRYYYIVGVFFKSVIRECIERNNQRSDKERIPAKAIAAKSNQLQFPHYDEGFDELYYAEQIDGDFMLSKWTEE